MLGHVKEQRNLTREQKQAVGLLSVGTVGTFLEYFDSYALCAYGSTPK